MVLVFNTTAQMGNQCLERTNNMKRSQSNIVNTQFTIENTPREDSKGRALKNQGVVITHATVNGASAGVGLRTVNGKQKSSEIKLDIPAMRGMLDAINEILAEEG